MALGAASNRTRAKMNNEEYFNWLKPTFGALVFGVVMYVELYVLERTGYYFVVAISSMICAVIAFVLLNRFRDWTSSGRIGTYIFAASSLIFSLGCFARIFII